MIGTCKDCSKEFKYFPSQSKGQYCSNKCQGALRAEVTKAKWRVHYEEGADIGRPRQRQMLTEDHGYNCSVCKLSEWQDKPITLQVDHIDGNADNNDKKNLRLICPNCHSQTDTFAGGNRGQGRWSKGLKDRYKGQSFTHGKIRVRPGSFGNKNGSLSTK